MANANKEDSVKELVESNQNLTKLPAKNKRAARLLDVARNPCAEVFIYQDCVKIIMLPNLRVCL